MAKKDFYQILGVTKTATDDEIKKAYRKIAKEHHPDVNPNNKESEEKFKAAAEAYEVLTDPDKKAKFDQYGDIDHPQQQQHDHFSRFHDFMSSFNNHRQQRRGDDLSFRISLTLEEILTGVTKKIKYDKFSRCEPCLGKGGTNPITCDKCNGIGTIPAQIRINNMVMTQTAICDKCNGDGEITSNICNTCHGRGVEKMSEEATIDIPHGIYEGLTMILKDKGNAIKNGITGDLNIVISELPHKIFVRNGFELTMKLKLSYSQLVLGSKAEISTIDGKKISITIPEFSQLNNNLRVKGKGLKVLNAETFGNLNILLDIDLPTEISDEERNLIKQLK
jgi:molecular chaperone DnaJ